MTNKSVTRKDVALKAGVSTAVVSYVLNNSGYVSEEKRNKVLQAVKELNYQPNQIARGLRMKNTNLLVFIANSIRNEFFAEIAYNMEKKAYECGYTTLVCNARNDEIFINNILGYQVDGIFVYSNKISVNNLNSIVQRNIPLVIGGGYSFTNNNNELVMIRVDVYSGIKKIMKHLIEKGHRRIAYIHIQDLESIKENSNLKMTAYIDSLNENGINIDMSLMCFDINDIYKANEKAAAMLKLPDPPTAFLAGNDIIAIGIMSEVLDEGYRIPEDIAVVGCDNIRQSTLSKPKLTTIDMPKEKIGEKAVELLLKMKRGEKVHSVDLDTSIQIREST